MRKKSGCLLKLVLMPALAVGLSHCSDSKFRGNGSPKSNPSPTPTSPPTMNECKEKSHVIGVDLAFVIDNSGSNVYTDCPNAKHIGEHHTENARYRCGGATNRESAVSDAYDALVGIAKGNAASDSQMAITSFPGEQNIFEGSETRTKDWVSVTSNDRASIAQAMAFTREPIGMTPYGAGLRTAADMFDRLGKSQKPKLLILVTDGEPTDSNPGQVVDQVRDRLQGVKIITVMVSQETTRSARKAEHAQYLQGTLGYNQGVIDQLIGGNDEKGLAAEISNQIIEVPASGKLKDTFMKIISENVTCK